MRTVEEIRGEIQRLGIVAAPGSPVPESVRNRAQNLCHTLTWVLDESVKTAPYHVMAGCCCLRDDLPENLAETCPIGPGMCLCPGWRE